MPRKQADLDADFDFKIFVDPSCLSAPMEEEISENKREECVEGTETVPERAEPMDIPEGEGLEPEVRNEDDGEGLENSHLDDNHLDDSHVDESHVDESHVDESHVDESHVDESHVDDSHLDSHVDDDAQPETLEPETEEQPEEEPQLSAVLDELESTLEKDIDDMLEQMHDDADEQQQSAEQDGQTEDDVGGDSTAEPLDAAHVEYEEHEEETPAVEEDEVHDDDATADVDSTAKPLDAAHEEHEEETPAVEEGVELHDEEVVQLEQLDQDETHEESVHKDEVQPEDIHEVINEDETYEEHSHDDETQEAEDEGLNDVPTQVEEEMADDKPSQENHPIPEEETTELNDQPPQDDELPLNENPTQEDDSLPLNEDPTQEDEYTEETSLLSQDSVHEDSLLEAEQDTLPPLSPRSPSHPTDRKTSLRTEALIQAAARAVVAKIEERAVAAVHSRRSSTYDNDMTLLTRAASPELSRVHLSPTRRSRANSPSIRPTEGDEGDSSSHHEADSDVFSDHSARSSIGSFDAPVEEEVKTPIRSREEYTPNQGRSPRISGVSEISEISAYDKEEEYMSSPRQKDRTPRMPFRTPSSVRALQMSSPTPSVFNGACPRSGKRSGGMSISRLGSPIASTQYSPKGRSTPPRLKSRKEAPLVLLHVTLLPLRWMWGEVIDGLDSATKDGFLGGDELTSLRDAWRQLQDRTGDTVLERGILLPHPQNDYEVLEERLLEALELPLKRRARILECGHYLSAANVEEMVGDSESEDDYGYSDRRRGGGERRHWCGTCQGEIKYEDLGPGKVFRVKVYASNGLMKAGAWEACWKEMERVDVEVEPIVDAPLQRELERLSAYQVEVEERKREEEERSLREEQEPHLPVVPAQHVEYDEHISSPPAMHASPPSPAQLPSSPMVLARSPTPFDNSEARRLRDEARLREIYGLPPTPLSEAHTPEPEPEQIPSSTYPEPTPHPEYTHPTEDSYVPHTDSQHWTPDSPSEEANARRSHRRTGSGSPYQSASLPELMLESVKVLLRDRKNVAIAVLSLFVLFLAVRPKQTGLDYRIQVPVEGYRFERPVQVDGVIERPVVEVVKESVGEGEMAAEETIWPHVTMSVASEVVEATPSVEVVDEVATSSEVVEATPSVDVADEVATRSEVLMEATPSADFIAEETIWPHVTMSVESEVVEATPSVEVADEVSTTSEVLMEATASADLEGKETAHAATDPVVDPALEASMTASVEATPAAEMEHNETPSPAPASDIPNAASSAESEPTVETSATDVAPTASVTTESNDDAPSMETTSAEIAPASSVAVEEPESTEHAEPAPTSANPCESLLPTSTSPAVEETTVTEKKIIRVFETITETETIRISVTTTQSYFAADATAVPDGEMAEFDLGGPYRVDEETVFGDEEV